MILAAHPVDTYRAAALLLRGAPQLAGWVAGFFDVVPVARLFLLVALAGIGASLVLALLIRPIRRLAEERPESADSAAPKALEAGGLS